MPADNVKRILMRVKTPTHKEKKTKTPVRTTSVKKTLPNIVVKGDNKISTVPVVKAVARKKMQLSTVEVPKVTSVPVLVSVSIDDASSKVARYSGLFYILVGACFASYAMSGLYVETVELSLNNQAFNVHGMRAEVINATLSTTTPSPTESTATIPTLSSTQQNHNAPITSPATSSTSSYSSSTVSASPVSTASNPIIQPAVTLAMKRGFVATGQSDVSIMVERSTQVELIVVPKTSLTEKYLGRAVLAHTNEWNFSFDSTQMPNGEYALFARVSNTYGVYQSSKIYFKVYNAPLAVPTFASTSAQAIEAINMKSSIANVVNELKLQEPPHNFTKEIAAIMQPVVPTSVKKATSTEVGTTTIKNNAQLTHKTASSSAADKKSDGKLVMSKPQDPAIDARANDFITSVDADFKKSLELYAVALRVDDKAGMEQMNVHIQELERQSVDRVGTELASSDISTGELIEKVRTRISEIMRDEKARTEKQERVILDRVGSKVSRDSDRDGVSDYDEENIYHTNPFSADTDNDGFTDGAEILAGYDPLSEQHEVVMAFEDPRTVGTIRPDILSVTGFSVPKTIESTSTQVSSPKKIIFSGKALPNSFVTIYIYSTPVIVTVKATADGSWSYSFDKELEDGQHHMYVGITDNSGKLIAKSLPFSFIKTANAYSGGTIAEKNAMSSDESPQLFSKNALVLTISLVVVMVGMLLVLLGAFLSRRPQTVLNAENPVGI